MNIDWNKMTVVGAKKLLEELEKIPLYDVSGGRQRNSKENETIIKLRLFLKVDV